MEREIQLDEPRDRVAQILGPAFTRVPQLWFTHPRRVIGLMVRWVLFFLFSLPVPVFAVDYVIESAPAWAVPVALPELDEIPQDLVAAGVHILLVDRQISLAGVRQRYARTAWKILNSTGLGGSSSFSIEFYPIYQTLKLHTARIIRNGEIIDQLQRSQLSLLQREDELESQIMDGGWTANFQFSDVRVGDILEYSHTVIGENPALKQHRVGSEQLAWYTPVARRQVRLTWPTERALNTRLFAGADKPQDFSTADLNDLRWYDDALPAFVSENNVPSWHFDTPWVQYSDFESWESVVSWARPIYGLSHVNDDVRSAAALIRDRHPDNPSAQLVAALAFVQEEIRYLGIEIGAQSLVPSAPELTLERRFGDCKDKTILLIAMLDSLGIQANPVLAHSSVGRVIPDMLPSPHVFNHMIASVDLNGQTYLLDPTLTQQGGGLDEIVQPDYGQVLKISADEAATFRDSSKHYRAGTVLIEESFTPSKELAADYRIQSRYTGNSADVLRRFVNSRSRQNLNTEYLNFTAAYYSNPSIATAAEIADDPGANVMMVNEHYLLAPLWSASEEPGRVEATFRPWYIIEYLASFDEVDRTHPVARSHPVFAQQMITVELDGEWQVEDEHHEIDDAQFRLARTVRFRNNVLTLDYIYESRADYVSANRVREYSQHVEKARDLLTFGLYQYTGDAAQNGESWFFVFDLYSPRELLQWGMLTLFIALMPLALLFMARAHRDKSIWLGMLSTPGLLLPQVRDREGTVLLLAVLSGMASVIFDLSFSDAYHSRGAAVIIAAILIGGAIRGVLQFYLLSGVWHLGAKMVGGKGSYASTRVAFGWSMLPYLIGGLVVAVVAIVTWPELFTTDGPKHSDHWFWTAVRMGLALQILVYLLWTFVNAVSAVAAAHAFSWGRSILAILLASLGLSAVIAAVLLGITLL